MKKHILILGLLLLSMNVEAQQGDGGFPKSHKLPAQELKQVQKQIFSEPNIAALRSEDAETDGKGIAPWRFGYNNHTQLNTENAGSWIELADGGKIWLLSITCENALTVNLTFENTVIPEGNELYVFNPSGDFVLGKFTSKHLYKGTLGAELVPGNTVLVEYYIPEKNKNKAGFVEVGTVTHGYRSSNEFQEKVFGESGSCNMNVNCPDGSPWVNQRNSALMLVSGSNGFCSGALINNTLNDGTPYVLTANHCYSNPASWIFRFNWQADGCSDPGSSPSFQSLSGAVLRARRQPSDMCLVEITAGALENGTVPEAYNPYFAGWNNSNTPPTSTISIHHPSGDIKKISFDDNPASAEQAMNSTEPASSWRVQWDRNTTTEGGSSGSPLFDQNGRIIGQLWGGGASCSNLTSPDFYGRVHNSWEPAGSDQSNQLKHWLDPNNSGVEFIDGLNLGTPAAALDASIGSLEGAAGTVCSGSVSPSFRLINLGSTVMTSAVIEYSYDNGATQTINWSGSLNMYESEVINLPVNNLGNGEHTFAVEVVSVNGSSDENAGNNALSSTFTTYPNGVEVQYDLQLDCYGSETSWVLENSTGNQLATGGPYPDNFNPPLMSTEWCLEEGCYKLILDDTFSDGISGGGWCSTTGYVTITDASGTIGAIAEEDADFGATTTINFCTNQVVGVQDLENEHTISVYPNPTNGKVNILADVSGTKRISIYSTTGMLVTSFSTEADTAELDLSEKATGVYSVHIETKEGVVVKRIIKQ